MLKTKRNWWKVFGQIVVSGGILGAIASFLLPQFFSPKPEVMPVDLDLATDKIIGTKASNCTLPKKIKTNGFNLTIACNGIISSETEIITGFTKPTIPPQKNKSPDGASGTSESGANGNSGENGLPGDAGEAGKDAGSILIKANKASGNISISNNGGDGGDGGQGGDAGNGGAGGKGQSSRSNMGGLNCDSGPGSGGNGGNGGTGGKGGMAGIGGAAGNVTIDIKTLSGTVLVISVGGKAGKSGVGGSKGQGGTGGAEGNLSKGCDSANRVGSAGSDGSTGENGDASMQGQSGTIKLKVGRFEKTLVGGSIKYP